MRSDRSNERGKLVFLKSLGRGCWSRHSHCSCFEPPQSLILMRAATATAHVSAVVAHGGGHPFPVSSRPSVPASLSMHTTSPTAPSVRHGREKLRPKQTRRQQVHANIDKYHRKGQAYPGTDSVLRPRSFLSSVSREVHICSSLPLICLAPSGTRGFQQ